MSHIAIAVENLSKRYTLGQQRTRSDGLRHSIEQFLRRPFSWITGRSSKEPAEFWALRDVSFEIKQGEVIGVIGRNGAGKSTLLKILSRITEPTSGRISIDGRVASLLEVGTGFHPELTGRENIFLNGAILGMQKSEIRKKFDEIVAFSEVEKFIDTPVKHYSSGMHVRLAFSVAAHLEPEILIVDEVLAVGDAQFQKKCLGKMQSVAATGRTILFVSHNMPTVINLCDHAILLQNGCLLQHDKTRIVVDSYLKAGAVSQGLPLAERTDRSGDGQVIMKRIDVLNEDGSETLNAISGQNIRVRIFYQCKPGVILREARATVAVRRSEELCFVLSTATARKESLNLEGSGHIDFLIRELPLGAGMYTLIPILESNDLHDAVENAAQFTVVDGDYFGTGRVRPTSEWINVGVLVRHSVEFSVTSVQSKLNG